MNNVILYVITFLIWGTTWYAIKLQIEFASVDIAVLYRTVLATICLIAWCRFKKLSLRFGLQDHFFLCIMGLSMFSLHYLFIYNATHYLMSGVISVVFSGASFLAILNNYIFFRLKPRREVVLGALIGVFGLCIFFWHEVTSVALHDRTIEGLALSGIGAVIFALGATVSKRNSNNGIAILPAMTVAMVYGVCVMIGWSYFSGARLVFPCSFLYWGSLLYLVIPGSIVAFLCYLQLIKNIGTELAGYIAVITPIIALFVSSGFEGYRWSVADLFALVLVICGNVLVMKKPK